MGHKLRRKKLIDRSLQLKLVGSFLAVGCLAALFQVILLNNSMLDVSHELPTVGDEVLARTPGLLARNMLITLGVLVPVTLAVGITVTHRVAGPAYRMRLYLDRIAAEGAPSAPCRIRERDELHALCDQLNAAVDSLVAGASGAPGTADETATTDSGRASQAA